MLPGKQLMVPPLLDVQHLTCGAFEATGVNVASSGYSRTKGRAVCMANMLLINTHKGVPA